MNVFHNNFYFEVIIFISFIIIIYEFILFFKFIESILLIKKNLINSLKIITSNKLDDSSKQSMLLKETSQLFRNQIKILIFIIVIFPLFFLLNFFLIDLGINLYKNFFSITHIIFCFILFLLYFILRKFYAR